MAWTVNGASTHATQLVAVFQVHCSLYGLTCVGYAQNSFQFVSRSPLIHVGRPELLPLHRQPVCSNWWFQWQMLFLVGGWMLKRRRNARCTAVADSVLINSRMQKKNLSLHSSHFAVNWRCCTALDERSSGGILKFMTSSFRCYVDHSHTMYISGNIDVRIWVQLFKSPCICFRHACTASFNETVPSFRADRQHKGMQKKNRKNDS